MAFPVGWPPRVASGRHSLRYFKAGTATANYSDNAYLFADQVSANPFTPLPVVTTGQPKTIVVPPTPQGTGTAAGDVDLRQPLGQQAVPHPMLWAHTIAIFNDSGADLYFSFDGVNDAGCVKNGEQPHYRRYDHEAGIAIKGNGAFRIEAW